MPKQLHSVGAADTFCTLASSMSIIDARCQGDNYTGAFGTIRTSDISAVLLAAKPAGGLVAPDVLTIARIAPIRTPGHADTRV